MTATAPGADDVRARAQKVSPELFRTVTEGHTSFDHVAMARRIRGLRPGLADESRLMEQLAKDRLLHSTDDGIESEYWCTEEYGGCALTTQGRLLSVSNTHEQELVLTEARVRQLGRDVEQVFARPQVLEARRGSARTLYSVLTRVMATADLFTSASSTPEDRDRAMATLQAEWRYAERRTMQIIQRQARFEYFAGVIGGVILALFVFGVVGWLAATYWPNQINAPAFLAASLAGSVGALVSVLERMMPRGDSTVRRQLVLDYTAPRAQRFLIGGARPLVGGIFAVVVYFALLGGLLTIQGPTSTTQNTPATFAFFGLLGFAAGFSERFATDILERAVAPLSGTDKDQAPVADQAVTPDPAAPPGPAGEETPGSDPGR